MKKLPMVPRIAVSNYGPFFITKPCQIPDFLGAFADKSGTTSVYCERKLAVGSPERCPTFMNKAKPFKICHCGYVFVTELDMYQKSMPVGLQKTDKKSRFDLELRICLKCKTTFAIKIAKTASHRRYTPPL